MRCFQRTLPTPEANLALDDALLEEAERGEVPRESLRLWELPKPAVVIGRSSRVEGEVRREACRRAGIPILRRASGGAAIVAGPGCLMYSLVLSYQLRPAYRWIDHAHRGVLGHIAAALNSLVPSIRHEGTSDLAMAGRKISGNSMRCRRTHLLYHGTLLYDFPLELVERCLPRPPREPDYRQGREHGEFIANLPASPEAMREAIVAAFAAEPAEGGDAHLPLALVDELVARYRDPNWNFQR
jgi:lipoate-protein ligase A